MDKAIQYIWQLITSSFTLYAFFFMLFMVIIKCLMVSVYFSLIYFGISIIKKHLHTRMSVRVNYYCWYALLFSVILVSLGNYKTQLYDLYGMATATPYVYVIGCVFASVWIVIVICKLTVHIRLNYKIKKSFKSMERYGDDESLLKRAVTLLGLRKNPDIFITEYIDAPVSYGVFKKTILLPFTFKDKYSSDELFLMLLHEMAHIRNFDTVKLRIISIAECFFWVTPAIRLFSKQFKRDSEILCDNLVMGIQDNDRDTYGNLILKECVVRNTTMGLGFSDSYYALSNRLDALYRYKPEKHRRVSITVVIMMAYLIISGVSYFVSSNYLTLNHNSEFEIMLTNAELTNVERLGSDVCDGIYYKVTDDDICIDKLALGELASSFSGNEYDRIYIFSILYHVDINESTFIGRGNSYLLSMDELTGIPERDRYYTRKIDKLGAMETLFLRITSKL